MQFSSLATHLALLAASSQYINALPVSVESSAVSTTTPAGTAYSTATATATAVENTLYSPTALNSTQILSATNNGAQNSTNSESTSEVQDKSIFSKLWKVVKGAFKGASAVSTGASAVSSYQNN